MLPRDLLREPEANPGIRNMCDGGIGKSGIAVHDKMKRLADCKLGEKDGGEMICRIGRGFGWRTSYSWNEKEKEDDLEDESGSEGQLSGMNLIHRPNLTFGG